MCKKRYLLYALLPWPFLLFVLYEDYRRKRRDEFLTLLRLSEQ